MRPIRFPASVNHMSPSEPSAIPSGDPPGVGNVFTITPDVFISPIASEPGSVNQRLPPGPEAMLSAVVPAFPPPVSPRVPPAGYSVIPFVVPGSAVDGSSRPIMFRPTSVNHKLPSGPTVSPSRPGTAVAELGTVNSLIVPVVVIRPICASPWGAPPPGLPPSAWVNHNAPRRETMSVGPFFTSNPIGDIGELGACGDIR